MNPTIALTDLGLILAGAFMMLVPHLSGPGIFFGKTVTPGFSRTPEARAILSFYRTGLAAVTGIAAAVVHLLRAFRVGATPVPTLVFLAGGLWLWVTASRRVPVFEGDPSRVRTASLERRAASFPGGWMLWAGPFLILVLAALALYAGWDSIPERFPLHWDLQGTPDGWSYRTFGGVFGLLLQSAALNGVMVFLAYALLFRTRQVTAAGVQAEREYAFKRLIAIFLIVLTYITSARFAMTSLRPIWPGAQDGTLFWLLSPLSTAIVLVLTIYLGNRWRRRSAGIPLESIVPGDGTPDSCWKWGLIYYNPMDPAVLVEKRFGIGWTLNFARWRSWVFLIALIGLPVLVLRVVAQLK